MVDGVVYSGSVDGTVYALKSANGAKLWNYSTGDNNEVLSSPAVADGVVYIGAFIFKIGAIENFLGYVYALNAANGANLEFHHWRRDLFVSCGGRRRNLRRLRRWYGLCFKSANGAKLWNYTTGGFVNSSPAVVDGVVYIGSNDGNVYALNATKGDKLWNYTTGSLLSRPLPLQKA